MNVLLGLLGVALLALMAWDVFTTTLGQGGGPLFLRVLGVGWRSARAFARRGRSHHRLLATGGVLAVLVTIFLWLGMAWVGWTLVLSVDPASVVDEQTHLPVDFVSRLHYVGYIMVTLTRGHFLPMGDVWNFVSLAATVNGFLLITLSITYLLAAVQASTSKRQIAQYIASLGSSGAEIVARGWDSGSFNGLEPHLQALTGMVAEAVEGQLTYPAARFFHAVRRRSAAAPNLAALDEALTILQYAVRPGSRPLRTSTEVLRRALGSYMTTLRHVHIHPAERSPLPPDLRRLDEAGVPLVPAEEFRRHLAELDERRRLLLALVEAEGWSWEDVHSSQEDSNAAECSPASEDEREERRERRRRLSEPAGAGGARAEPGRRS